MAGRKKVRTPSSVVLTHSAKSLFLNCQRKFKLQYEEKLTPKKMPIPLIIGTIVHEGLAGLMVGKKIMLVKAQLQKEIAKARANSFADPDEFEKQATTLEGMVTGWANNRGYLHKAKPWIVNGKPAVEIEFVVKLDSGDEIRGKIDGIVKDKDGLWIVEHKTAGGIDSAYVKRLAIDPQVTMYNWVVRKLYNVTPVGTIYNVIRKPSIRQTKKETPAQFQNRLLKDYAERPEFYFYQEKLYRDDVMLREFEESLGHVIQMIHASRKSGIWLKNEGQCTQYGVCQFLPVCAIGRAPEVMGAYYVREKTHQEFN